MTTTLASARAKVLQIADQIAIVEREMSATRNAIRSARPFDAERFNHLSCEHSRLYRSLRGAKGAVTRLLNQGAEG